MNIKKNFLYNMIYQILIIILPIFTIPYISRVLGPASIGIYSYSFSVASFFLLFAMLGVKVYGSRSCAMVRDDKEKVSATFWGIYLFQLFVATVIICIYLFYVIYFVEINKSIAIIQIILIVSGAIDINWFFFGLEQFKLTVTRNIIIKILTILAIFAFVKYETDLWIYTLIMGLGTFLSQLVLWPFLYKYVKFIKPSLKEITKHVKPNLTLFIPVIAVSIYKITDKIMLGALSNMAQLGLYELTDRIINLPLAIITALGVVMLPRMSNLAAKGDEQKSKIMIEKSMFFVMFIGSALTFGISGIAPVFAPLFFGKDFVEVSSLITYIAPTILFISWANVLRTQYLIPNCKDKVYILSVLLGAFVNIVINIILIPKMGAIGAIIGTLAAEGTVCICQTFMVRNQLEFQRYFNNGIIFIIAGAVMFILVRKMGHMFSNPVLTLFIQVSLGAVIYLLLSGVYLSITKNKIMIQMLKPILKNFKKNLHF
ncbi:oligosaccharide flippase family protein [Schinkia azotoformans]|uniref:oligosaccharide flippase family protein n=1 Tax=Schinkia azotoformans TaxID=1454 RepID=UPI002DBB06CA|nr:oligosaccharide flippase family protein [Schinkia azotoformans]MEC1714856.1 oligosaccharide flippase family protein [Schinkia azotoformans]